MTEQVKKVVGFTMKERIVMILRYLELSIRTLFVKSDQKALLALGQEAGRMFSYYMVALGPSKELVRAEVDKRPMEPFGVPGWTDTFEPRPAPEQEHETGHVGMYVGDNNGSGIVTNVAAINVNVMSEEGLIASIRELDPNKYYFIWVDKDVPFSTVQSLREALGEMSAKWVVLHGPRLEITTGQEVE